MRVAEAYRVLGLDQEKSWADVNRAYRALVVQHYADTDQSTMMQLNEARDVLREHLHETPQPARTGPARPGPARPGPTASPWDVLRTAASEGDLKTATRTISVLMSNAGSESGVDRSSKFATVARLALGKQHFAIGLQCAHAARWFDRGSRSIAALESLAAHCNAGLKDSVPSLLDAVRDTTYALTKDDEARLRDWCKQSTDQEGLEQVVGPSESLSAVGFGLQLLRVGTKVTDKYPATLVATAFFIPVTAIGRFLETRGHGPEKSYYFVDGAPGARSVAFGIWGLIGLIVGYFGLR